MTEEGRSTVEPGFIHRRLKFPLLEREDRVALTERVNKSSSADVDYIVMMTLAAVLASLGLMQGATAVVIGAMLVAPLMGPLLGAGLAVTQSNLKLFRDRRSLEQRCRDRSDFRRRGADSSAAGEKGDDSGGGSRLAVCEG